MTGPCVYSLDRPKALQTRCNDRKAADHTSALRRSLPVEGVVASWGVELRQCPLLHGGCRNEGWLFGTTFLSHPQKPTCRFDQ